jgi:hypothetical protein
MAIAMGGPTDARRQSQMVEVNERLNSYVSQLEEIAQALEQRLSAVLRSEPPTAAVPAGSNRLEPVSVVPMASAFGSIAQRLQTVVHALRSVNERLEV